MIDQAILPDRGDEMATCGFCGAIYLPYKAVVNGNQITLKMEYPWCGSNDYTKTTYIAEDGKIPLTISN
jgi:hypothetical protein